MGLLASDAQRYVDDAFSNSCSTQEAHEKLLQERIKRNWEALTKEGSALRDAENYPTNYHYVYSGNVPFVNWFAMGALATPLWQGKRLIENMMGEELHSPPSLNAMAACYEGANNAYIDRATGRNRSTCGCEKK